MHLQCDVEMAFKWHRDKQTSRATARERHRLLVFLSGLQHRWCITSKNASNELLAGISHARKYPRLLFAFRGCTGCTENIVANMNCVFVFHLFATSSSVCFFLVVGFFHRLSFVLFVLHEMQTISTKSRDENTIKWYFTE